MKVLLNALLIANCLSLTSAQDFGRFLQVTDDHDEHDDHDHDDHDEESSLNDEKPWAKVIVASLVINLVSLVGLVFVVMGFAAKKRFAKSAKSWKFTSNIIPSFACGALLATTVFLIIPESLHMILGYLEASVNEEDGHEGEEDGHEGHNHMRFLQEDDHEGHEEHEDFDSAVAWRFGLCILCGFLIPSMTALFLPSYHEPTECETCDDNVTATAKQDALENDGSDEENGSLDKTESEKSDEGDEPARSRQINWNLAGSILIGDFFHNFTDGILVGTAFTLCHYDLAIAISAATVYHEIAQEIADFFMLTKHCNMKAPLALFLNFLGGLSVMIGAIVILSVNINSMVSGCILAVGGGVYINIAAVECLPRALAAHRSKRDIFVCFFSFVVGAVPIGLVLLDHEHCGDH